MKIEIRKQYKAYELRIVDSCDLYENSAYELREIPTIFETTHTLRKRCTEL